MSPRVTIDELFRATRESLKLELLAGRSGLSRAVEVPRIQKPGLALAGYLPQIHPDRIQIQFFTGWKAIPTVNMAPADEAKTWAGKSCFVIDPNGVLDPSAECQW